MKRRDFIFTSLLIVMSVVCIRLYFTASHLQNELNNWEESRFEMTRILSEIQKRLFLLGAGDVIKSLDSSQIDIYRLNLFDREKFSQGFLKIAEKMHLMALILEDRKKMSHHSGEKNVSIAHVQDDKFPDSWPTEGTITSLFGLRKHPIYKALRFHSGVDIANLKNTEILATANATVKFAGKLKGYGNAVLLDHGNGFESLYGHAEDLLVKEGDTVKKGELIASMGSTGISTGNHLHYEIRYAGEALNPVVFVK